MSNDSLQTRLHARFERSPDGNALCFFDESSKVEWLSFADVYSAAFERAKTLSDHGIGVGDVCILIPENDEFSTTSLLAILILGAVPVCAAPPVVRGKHSNLKDVLSYLIRKTGARAVIASEHMAPLLEDLPNLNRRVQFLFGNLSSAHSSSTSLKPHFPSATDIAALQLTSGTTGFPKVCVWNQRGVLAALDGMNTAMKLSERDVCVNWTPLYHDMGLVNNFMLCMVKGIPLVMLSTFEFVKHPALWLNALSATKATLTWSPNFGFAIAASWIKDEQIEGINLESVQGFWNAAERIHLQTIETFHRRFAPYGVARKALKTNFGLAENVGGATFSDPDGMFVVEHLDGESLFKKSIAKTVNGSSDAHTREVTAVGVGRPYPGLEVKIISRTYRNLPDGHVGEIAFVSPSRMTGYLKDAKATRMALAGDLVRTGDIGYTRNGEVFWLGRVKERINLNGKKFDPSDFENALLNIDGLRKGSFAAFGIPDTQLGTERLVIVAEKRNSTAISDKTIWRNISGSISSQLGVKVSEVLLLAEGTISKTSSGKRRHRHYRILYMNGQLEPLVQLKMS